MYPFDVALILLATFIWNARICLSWRSCYCLLWIIFDSSFHWIPPIIGQDLRLQFLSDPNVSFLHAWDICGPRLLVFAIVASVGLVSTIVVFARIFVDSETERSIRSLLLATALVAFWLSLIVSYNQLSWVRSGIAFSGTTMP